MNLPLLSSSPASKKSRKEMMNFLKTQMLLPWKVLLNKIPLYSKNQKKYYNILLDISRDCIKYPKRITP
jgi:hypothetical protein